MSTDPDSLNSTFSVNIDNILVQSDIPDSIKDLFGNIKQNGYANTGKFFQRLTFEELQILRALSELAEHNDQQAITLITLLGIGLILAEGVELNDDATIIATTCVYKFIALEHLYREGLVEVFYENWTIDPSSLDPEKVIAYIPKKDDDNIL